VYKEKEERKEIKAKKLKQLIAYIIRIVNGVQVYKK